MNLKHKIRHTSWQANYTSYINNYNRGNTLYAERLVLQLFLVCNLEIMMQKAAKTIFPKDRTNLSVYINLMSSEAKSRHSCWEFAKKNQLKKGTLPNWTKRNHECISSKLWRYICLRVLKNMWKFLLCQMKNVLVKSQP